MKPLKLSLVNFLPLNLTNKFLPANSLRNPLICQLRIAILYLMENFCDQIDGVAMDLI